MTKQSLPAVSTVTEENLEEVKTMDNVVVIGYISPEDEASTELFTEVAESERDSYLFGSSSDADLAKAESVKQPSIVLYKDFDEKKAVFDGSFEKDAILKWIKMTSTPLVGEVNPDTYSGYVSVRLQPHQWHLLTLFCSFFG
jgi:protein disulfide-isomerase A1